MKSPSGTKKPYTKYKSTNATKKWDVYVPTSSGTLRKVSYGASGMSDYTIHHDKERRTRYRNRHASDHIDDPYKPGFWSWWHLWGATTNSGEAFQQAVRRAKRILRNWFFVRVANIHIGVMSNIVTINERSKKIIKWNPFIWSYINESIKVSTNPIKDDKLGLGLSYIDFLHIKHTSLCRSHSS